MRYAFQSALGLLLGIGVQELRGQSACEHGGAEDDLLRLTAHANVVVGGGQDGDFHHALHGHDPDRGVTLQGLELAAFSNLTTYVQGFTSVNLYE